MRDTHVILKFIVILMWAYILTVMLGDNKLFAVECATQTVTKIEEISCDVPQSVSLNIQMDVPDVDTSFKAYMDYRTITCRTSVQYQMQQEAYTDEYGFRKIDGRYMVAVGTYYSDECGTLLDVTLDNGEIIECVVGDIKQDVHTDILNQHTNGNVIEFIVDSRRIDWSCRYHGDMSYAMDELDGHIASIIQVIENVDLLRTNKGIIN